MSVIRGTYAVSRLLITFAEAKVVAPPSVQFAKRITLAYLRTDIHEGFSQYLSV